MSVSCKCMQIFEEPYDLASVSRLLAQLTLIDCRFRAASESTVAPISFLHRISELHVTCNHKYKRRMHGDPIKKIHSCFQWSRLATLKGRCKHIYLTSAISNKIPKLASSKQYCLWLCTRKSVMGADGMHMDLHMDLYHIANHDSTSICLTTVFSLVLWPCAAPQDI